MILQALLAYYEALAARGEISPPGWGPAKISFALCISKDGRLEQVASLQSESERGKPRPRTMQLPAAVKRTVGIASNFLWDNAGYLLGVDNKGKPERSLKCFACCRLLHQQLLADAKSPAARALLAFFNSWQPEEAPNHPALQENWAEITGAANLVFRFNGQFIHDDPEIRQIWQQYYNNEETGEKDGNTPKLTCLITGKCGPAEATHPSIKGVLGAQSSGAALVSFNAEAFCSYGREQNLNAPVSKYAAFAYTTALNRLLADSRHVSRFGDTTVVCWAQGGEPAYQNAFMAMAFGEEPADSADYTEDDLLGMLKSLCRGEPVMFEDALLSPDTTFYVLGLSPNAARLSVRFFLRNSFGSFLSSVMAHRQRLEICGLEQGLSLWRLLRETVNQNANDQSPLPNLTGEVLRSILTNTPYPATLLNQTRLRIRAERKLTPGRAAIIKAYYLRNTHKDVPKEVLTVKLNPDSTNIPYTLGRLFAVLEAVQSAANPGLNATIKDKYFDSAAATPSHVFPTLLKLAQKHLRKLTEGQRIYYDKQICGLMGILAEEFPNNLTLPQQGGFQLGYYHQYQQRFQKKEEQ